MPSRSREITSGQATPQRGLLVVQITSGGAADQAGIRSVTVFRDGESLDLEVTLGSE